MGVIRLYAKKGCGYIRVSTDRQEELSPDAQKRLILDYAEKNNIELNEEDIYMDIGISGKIATKRPGFQRMIANAKAKEHPYDTILVWKFSRFARNQEESIVYKALLKRNDVDVVSVSEPLVEGPFGTLIERIIEWMDEYYSIRLSGEVKRGMQEKVLKQGYVTTAPFGYTHEKGKVPVINEREATAVRQIFEMYVDNIPIRQIALWLNEHGYKTQRGATFDVRRVTYILNNPFYIGKMRYKDTVYEGVHDCIVSNELYYTATNKYSKEYKPAKRKPADSCAHWLSGMLICPNCGGALGYNRGVDKATGKAWPIFYCWKSGKGKCDAKTSISAKKAEENVIQGLQDILTSSNIDYEIIRNETSDEEYALLEQRLNTLKKKEERAKAAYMDGVDSLEDYKENRKAIQIERDAVQKKIKDLDKKRFQASDDYMYGSVNDTISILTDDSIEKEKKAAALRRVCKKIEYDKTADEMSFFLYMSI